MATMQMGKSLSAKQLHVRMAMSNVPVKISDKGKDRQYKGYVIRERPELVPGQGTHCSIALNGEGLAFRRGLPAAKEWIDADIASKQPIVKRVKVRLKVKKVFSTGECSRCQGTGMRSSGAVCKQCDGMGEVIL